MRTPSVTDLIRDMVLALAKLREPAYIRMRPAASATGRQKAREEA